VRKKFLAVVLAVTIVLGGYPLFAQNEHKVSIALTHQYQVYNDGYFDGKLPKTLLVYVGSARGNAAITVNIGNFNGLFEAEYIEINPAENPIRQEEYISLLHEMCHVSVGLTEFEEHGPKWHQCMRTLAAEGAFDDLW
jgi:hypothetical protein